MYFIEPGPGALEAFTAQFPADKAVVMLNLLRFREQAQYQARDKAQPCTGFEAFMRYGAGVTPLISAAGGEQVWQGRQAAMLIGPQDKDWHLVVLVRYPERAGVCRDGGIGRIPGRGHASPRRAGRLPADRHGGVVSAPGAADG